MSYTPTEWGNGDVITAAKLNKMEQGISEASSGGSSGGGIFWLTETPPPAQGEHYGIDASYNEIVAALESGKTVILRRIVNGTPPKSELQYLWQYFSYAVDDSTNVYEIGLYSGAGNFRYTAEDPDAPMSEIYD